ncbi:MAG: hypothetical protein ACYCTF_05785 [Acidiferrobacter sp.]
MPKREPNTASLQQRLGPVCKLVMAGEVLAASPSHRHKSRLRTPWTIIVSGEAGPYSISVTNDSGIRVVERLRPGDFIVAEATLIPRGARCEIRALLIQSNRESRLPVVPANPTQIPDAIGADAENQDTAGLPWEDTGS